MEARFKVMEVENCMLVDFVHRLQARIFDLTGEYPKPPTGLNLAHPHPQAQSSHDAPEPAQPSNAPAPAPAATSLEVAAQAVAGLNRSEHLAAQNSFEPARNDDDMRTAQEITRQLQQADGVPDGLPSASM